MGELNWRGLALPLEEVVAGADDFWALTPRQDGDDDDARSRRGIIRGSIVVLYLAHCRKIWRGTNII